MDEQYTPPSRLLSSASSPLAEDPETLLTEPLTLEQIISFVQDIEPRDDTNGPSYILTHRVFTVLGCRYVLMPDNMTVVNLGSEPEGEFRGSSPR